jgi:hypothetical protein
MFISKADSRNSLVIGNGGKTLQRKHFMMLAHAFQNTGNVDHPLVLFYRQPGSQSLQPVVSDYGKRKVMIDSDVEMEDDTNEDSNPSDETSDESDYETEMETETETENEDGYTQLSVHTRRKIYRESVAEENNDGFPVFEDYNEEMDVDNDENSGEKNEEDKGEDDGEPKDEAEENKHQGTVLNNERFSLTSPGN